METPLLLDLPDKITTDRLVLRVPAPGDGQSLYEAISDGYEDFVKWLNWPKELPSYSSVEVDCRIHKAQFILREDIRFLIINKETNEIMGRCGYPPPQSNWEIPSFGMSYFLARRFRSQGYAQEALNALTRYAFHVLKARKVQIQVDPENELSLKIPQHLGFSLEAQQKGCWVRRDIEELAELWTYVLFDPSPLPFLKVEW
jgi:RimJ/RimL family protein N-acetyltransferase